MFLWLLAIPSLRRRLREPAPWIGALLSFVVFLPVAPLERDPRLGQLRQAGRAGRSLGPGTRPPIPGRIDRGPDRACHAARVRDLPRRDHRRGAGRVANTRSGLDAAGRSDPASGAAIPAARTRRPGTGQLAGHHLPGRGDRGRGSAPDDSGPVCGSRRSRSARPSRSSSIYRPRCRRSRSRRGSIRRCGSPAGLASPPPSPRRPGRREPPSSRPTITLSPPNSPATCRGAFRWSGSSPAGLFSSLPAAPVTGRTGILVRSVRRGDDLDRSRWSSTEEIGHASRVRDEVTAETFRLYRVIGGPEGSPAVTLPRRGLTRDQGRSDDLEPSIGAFRAMRAKGDKKGGNRGAGIIIRKEEVIEGGHHGGAWKVAYADFVTAMMAFFLLMWLLNATTEEQRKGLADYFSPSNVLSRASSGTGQPFGGHTPFDQGTMVSDRGAVQVIQGTLPIAPDEDDEDDRGSHAGTTATRDSPSAGKQAAAGSAPPAATIASPDAAPDDRSRLSQQRNPEQNPATSASRTPAMRRSARRRRSGSGKPSSRRRSRSRRPFEATPRWPISRASSRST